MNRVARWMNRAAWWAALTLIGTAAAGTTAWSLYTVAHDIYGVPQALAVLTAAVYDGAAIACLYLASAAAEEGRSAAGPRLAVLALASVSVALNKRHADYIHGGLPALLLFAAPTAALLIVADLAWAATRARRRAAEGERPVTLPRYGLWGWLLATEQAWDATRQRAVDRVTSPDPMRTESAPRAERPSATSALRAHFATMDPIEAIHYAHAAQPGTPPAELAAELVSYGVTVSPVQVAMVLHYRGPEARIDRTDASASSADPDPAPATPTRLSSPDPVRTQSAPRPETILDAVKDAVSRGIVDEADTTAEVSRLLGRPVKQETVRKYLSGKARPGGIGQGGGGYN